MSMKLYKLLIYFCMAAVCSADLDEMVRYYETLDSENLQVVTRQKRGADGAVKTSKRISFQTLGRKFDMVLFPGSSVLGPDFEAWTVDGKGRRERLGVDPNDFYSGYLEDNQTVEVVAHFEEGIFSSSIYCPDDTYVVEPAWRHLPNSSASMITYRHSDVNWEEILPIDPETGNRTRMKDGIPLPPYVVTNSVETNNSMPTVKDGKITRRKRAVTANTCPMLVVGDYRFYRDMGNSKAKATAGFLISTMTKVDRHYRRTKWDDEFFNMGLQIRQMAIYTEFTEGDPEHYNADEDWDYDTKLNGAPSTMMGVSTTQALTREPLLASFCLGHLFTSTSFDDSVLGIAYTGGICSSDTTVQNPQTGLYETASLNCGLSTARNSKNVPVLSLQQELVTTHEMGHNWGSNHDPVTAECAPSDQEGGKFVMWAISVTGYEVNNKVFSPCSRRQVSELLELKAANCFQQKRQQMCGNGKIEGNEECDSIVQDKGKEDPCCSKKCRLKEGAYCSDLNHDCCENCKLASANVVCQERNDLTCQDESHCDGISHDCPESGYLPDDTKCIESGICKNGICVNFCMQVSKGQKQLTPCLCQQNVTTMCQRCCAEVLGYGKHGSCHPSGGVLTAGRTCFLGYCDETGVCIKKEKRRSGNLFRMMMTGITINRLMEIMKSNIVATIIFLTLIVWVPASFAISHVDRKKQVEGKTAMRNQVTRPPTQAHTGFKALLISRLQPQRPFAPQTIEIVPEDTPQTLREQHVPQAIPIVKENAPQAIQIKEENKSHTLIM